MGARCGKQQEVIENNKNFHFLDIFTWKSKIVSKGMLSLLHLNENAWKFESIKWKFKSLSWSYITKFCQVKARNFLNENLWTFLRQISREYKLKFGQTLESCETKFIFLSAVIGSRLNGKKVLFFVWRSVWKISPVRTKKESLKKYMSQPKV